jgi:hypothetical protein
MRVTSQKQNLPIKNYDGPSLLKQYVKHGVLLGGGCKRGLLVGGSGCGKTNVMISLVEHPNGLRFENVYVYSKSLYQPKYEYLRKLLKPIRDLGYFEYEDSTQIVSPKDVKNNSVFIFDDVVCDTQSVIRDYFCFGRHKSIDCFYLSQTYSSIPKQLIRDNANLIVLFKQDNTNLKHIYNDHVNVDMSFNEFKNICSYCWKNKYGFLVINKDSEMRSGRYRKGFDCYIHL